jgi:hypothetical protein
MRRASFTSANPSESELPTLVLGEFFRSLLEQKQAFDGRLRTMLTERGQSNGARELHRRIAKFSLLKVQGTS